MSIAWSHQKVARRMRKPRNFEHPGLEERKRVIKASWRLPVLTDVSPTETSSWDPLCAVLNGLRRANRAS